MTETAKPRATAKPGTTAGTGGAAGTRDAARAGNTANTGAFTASDWALFASISLIWGSSFVLIAFSLEGLTPAMVTLLRVGLGAATLWVLRLWTSRSWSQGLDRIADSDRPRQFALSVVWVAIRFTLFPLAQ